MDRDMAEQELDLIQFGAREVARRAHVRRKSCGASLSMPARAAAARTTSHSTFGDMPSPHTRPALLIARNTATCVILAAAVHAIDVLLDPGWDGHRSPMSAFADEIRNHRVLLALLNRLELQGQQFSAA